MKNTKVKSKKRVTKYAAQFMKTAQNKARKARKIANHLAKAKARRLAKT
jgi:hypothetical protein